MSKNDKILEELLKEEIEAIENGDIYAHGYPEARLMPCNFGEQCQEALINDAQERISKLVEDKLREFM